MSAGVIVLVLGGSAAAWWTLARPQAKSALGPSAVVTRGPMVIALTESGELEAERRRIISNELSWPTIIQQVVPEGTLVREGDAIIRFECKELLDAIEQQKLSVSNADSDYTSAQEGLTLKKKETENAVQKARQQVIDAQQDQRKYLDGEWPVMKADAEMSIILAERDLTLAEEKLAFKLKVNEDPELNSPYSENEIKADRLGVDRLKNNVGQSIAKRDILVQYTQPREVRRLEMAVEDSNLGLERVTLEAKSQVRSAEALERNKKAVFEMHTQKLEELLEQEKKLVVTAEKEGLVVYDTGNPRWSSTVVNVQVGEKINPRQQLMIIPDLTSLQVKTRVYEAVVNQVAPGLEAVIRLDAIPEAPLTGKVAKVAVLPDSTNRWLSPDVKVFNVIVEISNRPEGLKPGMTAQVELVLARLDNVASVPIAAVFTEQERSFCWRVSGGKPEMVTVVPGKSNDKRVEIVSGLAEGDVVLLSPPPGAPPLKPREEKHPQTQPAAEVTAPREEAPQSQPSGNGERQPGERRSRGQPGPEGERARSRPAGEGTGGTGRAPRNRGAGEP